MEDTTATDRGQGDDPIRIDGRIGTDPEELRRWADHVVAGKPIEHMEIADLRALIEAVQEHPDATLAPVRSQGHPTVTDESFRSLTRLDIRGGRVTGHDRRVLGVQIALDLQTTFEGRINLSRARFSAPVSIRHSSCRSCMMFAHAEFHDRADFNGTVFGCCLNIQGAHFYQDLRCDEAIFHKSPIIHLACFDSCVTFTRAVFLDKLSVERATLCGPVRLDGSRIAGPCEFTCATFHRDLDLSSATIGGDVAIAGSTCHGKLLLSNITCSGIGAFNASKFLGGVHFARSRFSTTLTFGGSLIAGPADFRYCTFEGDAVFEETRFLGRAEFDGSTFHAEANFALAAFASIASFRSSIFKGATTLGGTTFEAEVRFDDAVFAGARTWFDCSTFLGTAIFDRSCFANVSFQNARFMAGSSFDNVVVSQGILPAGARFNSA